MNICDKIMLKDNKHNNLFILEYIIICAEANLTKSQDEMFHVSHSSSRHMNKIYLTSLAIDVYYLALIKLT